MSRGLALTGGRWVKDTHGVSRFHRDAPARRDQKTRPCPGGCGRRIRPAQELCRACFEAVALMAAVAPGHPICPACGCLLAHADEDCPGCRAAQLNTHQKEAA